MWSSAPHVDAATSYCGATLPSEPSRPSTPGMAPACGEQALERLVVEAVDALSLAAFASSYLARGLLGLDEALLPLRRLRDRLLRRAHLGGRLRLLRLRRLRLVARAAVASGWAASSAAAASFSAAASASLSSRLFSEQPELRLDAVERLRVRRALDVVHLLRRSACSLRPSYMPSSSTTPAPATRRARRPPSRAADVLRQAASSARASPSLRSSRSVAARALLRAASSALTSSPYLMSSRSNFSNSLREASSCSASLS